jgi:four helix bundle protein
VKSSFRELKAYRLPAAIGDELRRAIAQWPPLDQWTLGAQLLRAIDSVGANIAEGAGRWHRRDQLRFIRNARGSLYETEHWIARAQARALLDERWDDALTETARLLSGLIRKWERP